jgi:GNAT superfamily N-acetyltransferase
MMSESQALVINKATVDDIAPLCGLLDILFSQELEFSADVNTQTRGLRAIVENPELGIILVVRRNTELLGMVNLLFTVSTALGGRVAILEDMVVVPTERGSGVGSSLLSAAIATAREQGCQRITLLTDSANTKAHSFYENQGFTRSQMIAFRQLL